MSLMAFAFDVGTTMLVGRFLPGKTGMIVGGAAGGAVGQLVDGHTSASDLITGAASGAVGSAVGGAAAYGLGRWAGAGAKQTESALAKFAAQGTKQTNAADAVTRATAAKTAADDALANAGLLTRKGPLRDAARAADEDLAKALRQQKYVDDAVDRLAPAKKALEKRDKFLNKAEDALRLGNGRRKPFGKASGNFAKSGWGQNLLRGLGSEGGRVLVNGINGTSGGGGDSGGGDADDQAGVPTLDLVWAGSHVELIGTPPFVPQLPDPSIQAKGYGFLLEPSTLNASLKSWYSGPGDSVATSLSDNYKLFGDEKLLTDAKQQNKELDLSAPKELSAAGIGAGATGYAEAVKAMQAAAVHFSTIDATVVAKMPDVATITKQGRAGIADVICELNVAVTKIDGSDLNMSFVQLTAAAFGAIGNVTGDATGKELDIADYVKDLTAQYDAKLAAQTTAMNDTLQKSLAGLQNSQGNPAYTPPAVNTGADQTYPGNIGDLEDGSSQIPDPVGTDGTAGDSGLQRAIDSLENQAATPAVNSSYPGGVDAGTGMDSMGGMGGMGMGSLMDSMMQMMMMRNMTDNLNNRSAELDPGRYDDKLGPVTPPPAVAAQAPVAPATVATPATTAPVHNAAPSTPWSSQPANGIPGRTPGADGSVLYTFPDGRTQKVSAMVAQALDGAFGNASGTDAQKAYEKTPAKWSDKKQIGAHVDPYQLMTGDVATWDKRSAILVVFGSEEGGTLEAVVNGALKPFIPEMSDSAGEFGQFSGFVHPKGIELTAPKDGDVPSATPGTTDQSANAAVPIVAAPV